MIEFSRAAEQDVELIRELAQESWQSAYREILTEDQIDYMLAQMYSVSEITQQIRSVYYHYYIIKYNGVPAGFLGFEFHYEKRTTKLHRLYLLNKFRRMGIGSAALAFLTEHAKKAGENSIILNVNKNNPAKKMYEAYGFHVYDEGVFDIGSGFVMDDFLMRFDL